ncbi:MAG: 3'-5' exonuclease [Spirochaetales bacterium]|nr:3'-5' exonuclease [Spirochaetales bacterium]
MDYTLVTKPNDLLDLLSRWTSSNVESVSIDFEEESNLHCYGEHVCTVQIYDKEKYYIIDALELAKTKEGIAAMKTFLEGPIEKVMFACQSDAALTRKALGIQLKNIFDIRVIAMALDFNGNLTALIERNLGIQAESSSLKKKYQTANWMRRPIPEQQIEYALSDVQYLFDLKQSLVSEMKAKLSKGEQNKVSHEMKICAEQKNPERPGWEKICNYKLLKEDEKVYIKHFFLARDSLARKANVPASRILEKQLVVAMAKKGTWKGVLPEDKQRYASAFEKARLDAVSELHK